MKKINNLELAAIIIILLVNVFSGINQTILKITLNSPWLSITLGYLISFIPLLLIVFISSYEPNLPLNEKIKKLFGNKIGTFINLIIFIYFIIISITILYNINNFILSQLLNRTPILVSILLIMSLVYYSTTKGISTISSTSFILIILNITLFLINILSLFTQVKFDNYLPLLTPNISLSIITAIKIASVKSMPLLAILTIPKNRLSNPNKYNKTIYLSFIISVTISFLLFLTTYGVLGPNLYNIFEYPEYIVLRRINLFGVLERVENIISLQWIIGSIMYLTMTLYTSTKCLSLKKDSKLIPLFISIIIIILTKNLFPNNTIFNYYKVNIYPFIILSLFLIYTIITIKLLFKKKQKYH